MQLLNVNDRRDQRISPMEPHSMRNISDTDPVTFLCCIANVYSEDSL